MHNILCKSVFAEKKECYNSKAMRHVFAKSVVRTLVFLGAFGAVFACLGENPEGFRSGMFFVGVNFWGSQAGVNMWRERDWDEGEIVKDLDAMKACGVELMRVFPTWPDFQTQVRDVGQEGRLYEMFDPETQLPVYDPLWLDPGAMARFRFFCDECRKRNIRLMVSLITGWMSGRLFVPGFLSNLNPITSPEAIMWEGRFARGFVRRMKDHSAIVAWDLGNECNCMGAITSQAEAWNWLNAISSAIRMEDPSRPVVSGMHGQTSNGSGRVADKNYWTIQMQSELLDVLTPHPYPAPWRVDANRGPFNGLRNALHPVSQCLFYEGIAGKPAFPQEVGSFGPTITPDRLAARGFRQQMFAAWQHGSLGLLWWCAFRQTHLKYPPFCNNSMEHELGIVRADAARTLLPQAEALKAFRSFKDALPFKALPRRRIDAVVLLSERAEFYHQAFGAFMLAKQAGFDVAFCGAESRELPEAKLYIVPSGDGEWATYSNFAWARVIGKAESGATVLVTRGGTVGYAMWEDVTGLEQQMWKQPRSVQFELDGVKLELKDGSTAIQTPVSCEVLARDRTGNVVMSRKRRGKGQVLAFNVNLEKQAMASQPDVVEGDFSNELWRVYARAAREAGIVRRVTRTDTRLLLTEHPVAGGKTIVCALNTREEDVKVPLDVAGKIGRVWNGACDGDVLSVPGNDGCIFEIEEE